MRVLQLCIVLVILSAFTNKAVAVGFQRYAIDKYDEVGLPSSKNLPYSCQESDYFFWAMVDHGNVCVWGKENGNVHWIDWATDGAFVNADDFAFFVGHGGTNGPVYGTHGYVGTVNMMAPPKYEFGAEWDKLKWVAWSACNTLYDGVTDGSYVNWWGSPHPASRWFQTFKGLHCLCGMRSWTWYGDWWSWIWKYNSGLRGKYFVNRMYNGECITDAWFHANNTIIYGKLGKGFEAAAMNPHIGTWETGTNYHGEKITSPYADYSGWIPGFWYYWYRRGSPTY
jgi:hypothetical protein